ncbi:hypothetical protein Nepgr_006546 [Nepenthes gracilis]|uniref:Uncharacterized protein n=1 Tax=Nepenthes gracilis TaxID=150966 RepID=A0AAD3S5F4_NEPGR|nr:hypothetical protein Nepgr_006546 [Nepenthes gracilis]
MIGLVPDSGLPKLDDTNALRGSEESVSVNNFDGIAAMALSSSHCELNPQSSIEDCCARKSSGSSCMKMLLVMMSTFVVLVVALGAVGVLETWMVACCWTAVEEASGTATCLQLALLLMLQPRCCMCPALFCLVVKTGVQCLIVVARLAGSKLSCDAAVIAESSSGWLDDAVFRWCWTPEIAQAAGNPGVSCVGASAVRCEPLSEEEVHPLVGAAERLVADEQQAGTSAVRLYNYISKGKAAADLVLRGSTRKIRCSNLQASQDFAKQYSCYHQSRASSFRRQKSTINALGQDDNGQNK